MATEKRPLQGVVRSHAAPISQTDTLASKTPLRGRFFRRRVGQFTSWFVPTILLVALMLIPSCAGALEVTAETARPNGLAQTGIIGAKPTRVTWEADVAQDEAISQLTLNFPEGTDLEKATVNTTILDGEGKSNVETEFTVHGSTIDIAFSPHVAGGSHMRVLIGGVAFPDTGGDFKVLGSYVSDGEKIQITDAPSIKVEPASFTEKIIAKLDGAEWVKKWDSVPILNMFFKPQMIVAGIRTQFVGWVRALGLVAMGFPLAIPIGLLLAFIRISRLTPLKWLASIYITVIRGTPLFLQIYIAFFGLPLIGIQVNDYLLGGLVLAVNSSAYLAEIFRAGIQSIHKGQFEAAASLGLSYPKSMMFVIIPQTVRRVLPTMTSEFILLYKDTSLLAAVGVMELMMFSKTLVSATGNVTPYVVAALYYMLVTIPLIKLVQALEKKLAVAEGGVDSPSDKPKRRLRWKPASVTNPELTATEHGSH